MIHIGFGQVGVVTYRRQGIDLGHRPRSQMVHERTEGCTITETGPEEGDGVGGGGVEGVEGFVQVGGEPGEEGEFSGEF